MQASPRLIAALELSDGDLALALADQLRPWIPMVQVGLPLVSGADLGIVERLRREGHAVMLDLRYNDRPDRVELAVRAAARRAATRVTVAALGGRRMLTAATGALSDITLIPGASPPEVYATTLPEPGDAMQLAEVGLGDDPTALCRRLALLALDAGCAGLVVPAAQLAPLRAELGSEPKLICALEPASEAAPLIEALRQALRDGASQVVVGGALRRAADPAALAERLAAEASDVTA